MAAKFLFDMGAPATAEPKTWEECVALAPSLAVIERTITDYHLGQYGWKHYGAIKVALDKHVGHAAEIPALQSSAVRDLCHKHLLHVFESDFQ